MKTCHRRTARRTRCSPRKPPPAWAEVIRPAPAVRPTCRAWSPEDLAPGDRGAGEVISSSGWDSLLSIVQMPGRSRRDNGDRTRVLSTPVFCGLGTKYPAVAERLEAYRAAMHRRVVEEAGLP